MPTIWKFILENNKSTQMEQYKYIKLNLKTRIDVLMKIQAQKYKPRNHFSLLNENTIDVISYNTS